MAAGPRDIVRRAGDRACPPVRAIVQARMSSRRFPGKVLAPFKGQPLIRHVIGAVARALPSVPIVVATSQHESDEPLASYLGALGVPCFRGPLERVFDRFRLCVAAHPCDWALRLSADSPLLDAQVLRAVVAHAADADADLITTIFPRTFPRGQNAELLRVDTLLRIDARQLSAEDQEHVTPFYYRQPGRFRIVNVVSGNPEMAGLSVAVDTIEDLRRLEDLAVDDVSVTPAP
jgi:spore coat polysaccharide biosynthesis protein SpsF